MKLLYSFLFGLTLSLAFANCREKIYLYNLSITLDSSFSCLPLIDTIALYAGKNEIPFNIYDSNSIYYDTLQKAYTLYWDSLLPDEYQFIITTALGDTFKESVSLSNDSSLYIINPTLYKQVDIISYDEMKIANKVFFVFESKGCFHYYTETSILTKETGESYQLHTTSDFVYAEDTALNINRVANNSIIQDLYNSQLLSQKMNYKFYPNRLYQFSTTTNTFYIIVNKKFFKFSDLGNTEWDLYSKMRSRYIL